MTLKSIDKKLLTLLYKDYSSIGAYPDSSNPNNVMVDVDSDAWKALIKPRQDKEMAMMQHTATPRDLQNQEIAKKELEQVLKDLAMGKGCYGCGE